MGNFQFLFKKHKNESILSLFEQHNIKWMKKWKEGWIGTISTYFYKILWLHSTNRNHPQKSTEKVWNPQIEISLLLYTYILFHFTEHFLDQIPTRFSATSSCRINWIVSILPRTSNFNMLAQFEQFQQFAQNIYGKFL